MSDVARLRQQIDMEIQSMTQALTGYRATSRHEIINHYLANICGYLDSLPDGAEKQQFVEETLEELGETI